MKVFITHQFLVTYPQGKEAYDLEESMTLHEFLEMVGEKYKYNFVKNVGSLGIRYMERVDSSSSKKVTPKITGCSDYSKTMGEILSLYDGFFHIYITPNRFRDTVQTNNFNYHIGFPVEQKVEFF